MTTFNNFVSTIKTSGVAFQNHYFVNIVPPRFMAQTANQQMLEIIPFYVEAINLPEQQLATRPINDYGITREVVYEPLFGNVTATFFADKSLLIKSFFDNWVGAVSMTRSGRLMYPDQYKVDDLAIYVVNRAKEVTYVVILKNAYPKLVNDSILSAEGRGAVSFQVQFVYDSWESFSIKHDDPLIKNNNFGSLRNVWNLIQLVRTGANKDAIKSMIINTGTRKVMDVVNSTGVLDSIGKNIDSVLKGSGIGDAIGGLKGIVL